MFRNKKQFHSIKRCIERNEGKPTAYFYERISMYLKKWVSKENTCPVLELKRAAWACFIWHNTLTKEVAVAGLVAFPEMITYWFKDVNSWQAKEETALTPAFRCWAIQWTLLVKDKTVLQDCRYLVQLKEWLRRKKVLTNSTVWPPKASHDHVVFWLTFFV